MRIEKIPEGYLLANEGVNGIELWRQFNGAESWACAAIDELMEERDALRADKATLQQMTYSLKDRLEAAEKAVTEAYQRGYSTGREEIEAERYALRARIEQMEKQEPVAYLYEYVSPMDGKTPVWRAGRGEWNGQQAKSAKPLYLTPGAQPAPSVPDERAAFREWFEGEQGVAYDGLWSFAKAAWMARAALEAPEAKP